MAVSDKCCSYGLFFYGGYSCSDVIATGQSQRTLPPFQEVGANVLQPRTVSPEQAKIWVKVRIMSFIVLTPKYRYVETVGMW